MIRSCDFVNLITSKFLANVKFLREKRRVYKGNINPMNYSAVTEPR